MLFQRLLFGAILIAALIGLILADQAVSRSLGGHGLIVTGVLGILIGLASLELTKLFRAAGHRPLRIWPLVISVAMVLAPLDRHHAWLRLGDPTASILAIALAGTFFCIALRKQTSNAIADMATSLFAVLYVGLLPQYLMRLRVESPTGDAWLVLYVVATVKLSDIGAYFTGYAIGRHKMIPWLSPKKTLEGLAGGVVASIAMAIVYPLVAGHGDLRAGLGLGLSLWKAGLFGLLMAVFGQAGDLLESLIKRDAQAKDSAAAVPAFGGVLDIIDSLLLTAPLAYFILLK